MNANEMAEIRHLQTQITIELARAVAYSQAREHENALGCFERAENCNDRIYRIETGDGAEE